MSAFAGTTLVWPGTVLDQAWKLNSAAYQQLAPVGRLAGFLFFGLSAAMVAAAVGWFLRRRWGFQLAVVIIAIQALGDLVNLIRGALLRGGIGFVIAGSLLFYLLRRKIRHCFDTDRPKQPVDV
ncbi:MAG TPA: hypothetical protein VMU61_03985 [Candidatus Aquilonibacter sp.]|nr:hypothetical protein [Candidatus Aquilonibacter sp.]